MEEKENYKVFFIVSNLSKLDESIEYSFPNNQNPLNIILTKNEKYRREDFSIKVFTFEILKDNLTKKDLEKKKYKAKIQLNYNKNNFQSTCFKGEIPFRENRNNFIFDFYFDDFKGWTGIYSPPINIKFSRCQQLKIYNEALNKMNVKQGVILSQHLILDSQIYLKEKQYDLDFYLEILKRCYSIKEVKTLLMMFKLEKVILPEKLEVKAYSSILELIEEKPDIIIRYCGEKDNIDKYYKLFYSLLLFFRANYEKDKVQSLLNQKELKKYFIEILSENFQKFSNVELSEDFIDDMLKQKNITFNKIKNSLLFIISIEKLLHIIYMNIDLICEICKKENRKIDISEIAYPKSTDDLDAVIYKIQIILNYQLNKKITFITFNEIFWRNYIEFNDKKNLKNLILIRKCISLCLNIDKSFNIENLELQKKIHETGLEAIKEGKLKNEVLLDFIENDDVYFKGKKYESKCFRSLEVLDGIDLETVDDKFYEKWNKTNIFKIYSFIDYEFKQTLVNKVYDMKDFGKLLKLLNYNDKYTDIFLKDKFNKLILTFKIDKCPNFIKDASYFIYIIDKNYQGIKDFMKDIIEKNIKSFETLENIYLYLYSKYKTISKDVIDYIVNFLVKNKDNIKGESILILLEKVNSPNIIKSILNRIDNFIIKEEEIFNQEEEIDSFKLLSFLTY